MGGGLLPSHRNPYALLSQCFLVTPEDERESARIPTNPHESGPKTSANPPRIRIRRHVQMQQMCRDCRIMDSLFWLLKLVCRLFVSSVCTFAVNHRRSAYTLRSPSPLSCSLLCNHGEAYGKPPSKRLATTSSHESVGVTL